MNVEKAIIPETAAPIPFQESLYTLDVLRGFALLDILIMNIQSFAIIEAA